MVISVFHAFMFIVSAGLTFRIMIGVAKKRWSLNVRHVVPAVFFISLVVATILVTSYHGFLAFKVGDFNSSVQDKADRDSFFGIMFDAGSTGSRIHVFKFKMSAEGMMLEECFVENLHQENISNFLY